jgi:glycosyltransferase involved in cell wall biosynthesis
MRVLLGANVSEERGGGVATYVRQVAAGVERLGTTVDILWGKPAPPWMPGPAATLRFARQLASMAEAGGYDVVAAQGGEGALLKAEGPGRVVTSHGDEREAWRARLRYAPIPLRQRVVTPYAALPLFSMSVSRADVVIALHDAEAVRFREERSREPNTVHVVPNGCGPTHAATTPLRGHIVFVGEWLPRKGSLILPNIFRAVRCANPQVSLTLLGPDSVVRARFHQADRAHVRALGFVERSETEQALLSTDVCLLPSYYEGMPLAVLEALSFGVPVVGFDIAGTAAAVGRAGLLVPPGDVDECARALVRVITDRVLRARLSQEALARCQRLTWAATAERTLAAYEHAAKLSRS